MRYSYLEEMIATSVSTHLPSPPSHNQPGNNPSSDRPRCLATHGRVAQGAGPTHLASAVITVHVCVTGPVQVCMCMCMCMWVCVFVCVCMCMCVCMCVCSLAMKSHIILQHNNTKTLMTKKKPKNFRIIRPAVAATFNSYSVSDEEESDYKL